MPTAVEITSAAAIIVSNFTDSSVILLSSKHDYWWNLENTEKLWSLVHTLYMELFAKYWKLYVYWKIMQNTEKWEYLYWNSKEQVGGTVTMYVRLSTS